MGMGFSEAEVGGGGGRKGRPDINLWADARKRYTAMVPRHKGVHMNTP